jgi:hypothetical protein
MVGAAVRECTSVSAFPIITELSPYITIIYHYVAQCVVEERDGNYQRFHTAWVSCLSCFHWSLFTLEMFHQESHFSDLNGSVSYVDVCGYECALSFRDGMLFVEVVPCTAMLGSWLLSRSGGWGGIIGSGFLGGCQRLYWEIGSGCHSGGCWLRTQHLCRIFQPCSDGLLYCDGVTPAWYCQWGQRNAPVREGALYTTTAADQCTTQLPSYYWYIPTQRYQLGYHSGKQCSGVKTGFKQGATIWTEY